MNITDKQQLMLSLAGKLYHTKNYSSAPLCILQACKHYKLLINPQMLRLFTLHIQHGMELTNAEAVVSFQQMHKAS